MPGAGRIKQRSALTQAPTRCLCLSDGIVTITSRQKDDLSARSPFRGSQRGKVTVQAADDAVGIVPFAGEI